MNKRELAQAVTAETGLDQAGAEAVLSAITAAIASELAEGKKVTLPGFGTFEVRSRAARNGRNPQTGELIAIAASLAPAFKPATALKQTVRGD